MFVSKLLMEALPNIHLIGMLTMSCTVVFRKKALVPVYIFVLLNGIYAGFDVWWLPYLYIWAVLWGVTMLLPQNMPENVKCIVYPAVCALHGLLFGTLYAPVWALVMRLDFSQMLAWIVAGFPMDLIHAAGNFVTGLLIVPVSSLLARLMKKL